LSYLGGVVCGDLGPSYYYQDRTVQEIIATTLPVSACLGLAALLVALVGGVAAGLVAAMRRDRCVDRLVLVASALCVSLPSFVVGTFLLVIFTFWLAWCPVGGFGRLDQLILPAVTLALPFAAVIARITRASLLEELGQDYVRTARAKGLSAAQAAFRHALQVALVPVVHYLAPAAAGILTGSLVVEQIFRVPGIGRHFVTGALNGDHPLVLGLVMLYSVLLVTFNLVADLVHGYLDPRVREG
ncbi:unnamed protein product, partial [marine sediment metagenome]